MNFKTENLVVDWISFKFQHLEDFRQTKIARYLFKLGFNSYQESGKLAKPIKEPILSSSNNKFEVIFVKERPYWRGSILQFSGQNATGFFNLIQEKLIDWEIFSSGVLNRFDLYFYRKNKREDKMSVRDFLENCQRKLKQTNKNISFEKNSKGLILKIGNRRSNNYSRIYEKKNSLKFEHEMKGKFLQKYHLFLVSNNLEEFEDKLALHFLYNFGKILPLHYYYLDWLVIRLRPIRKQPIFQSGLNLHYLETNSLQLFNNPKKFISLLQFLVYAQNLDYEIGSLGSTSYRLVTFRVQDFLKVQKPNIKSTNYYQLKKLIEFLDELQRNSLIKFFTDTKYRSLVTIPEVNLQKSKQHSWIAEVWIAEELFYYVHPFLLPNVFQDKLTTNQFEVSFHFIKVFSSVSIQKEFLIQEYLDAYPSVLSNQEITKIKSYFIELVKVFQKHDLIENHYKRIYKGNFIDTQELTRSNISEGFLVYEKLSI
jgi:predicted HicB family RNase H-like nuclease